MGYQRLFTAALLAALLFVVPGIALPLPARQAAVVASPEAASLVSPAAAVGPFVSAADALDFLRHAEVVSLERIPYGKTQPRKVLLEKDGVSAYAVFRDVDESYDSIRLEDGTFYVTLQLWVEGAMTESKRRERGLPPTDYEAWLAQMRTMALFDFLAGNIDRHTGNYLLDAHGKMWFIDHTRAFQRFLADWSPRKVGMCERPLWERLQSLDEDILRETLSDVLTPFEIKHLVQRLDSLVAHIRDQIAQRGASAVIV